MKGDILFKDATLVDARGKHGIADVLIGEGRILSLFGGEAKRTIEAKGLYLSPGFLDLHTHLREPGQEVKEDLQSGLEAAVRGGYTDVVSMPNTSPVVDRAEAVRALKEKSARIGFARLHPAAALTQGQEGQLLCEARALREAGAVLLSDDGRTNEDAGVLALGLRYAASWGLPVAVHAEDAGLRRGGVMHEGEVSWRLGLPGNPAYAETARIARDLEVVRYVWEGLGVRPQGETLLHIQHLSTKRGLELVRQAKREGLPVSTEVTPHHLTLTEAHLEGLDPLYKVAPPLRTKADVEALLEGLLEGSIDCVATDHAPHTEDEKALDLLRAPFGIPSLEVAWPLLYTKLVEERGFPLPTLVARFSSDPRRILGLPPIHLEEGAEASLVLWNPSQKRSVDPRGFASKAKYSPWAGWTLLGWPVLTLVEGRVVWEADF
ncbi:MAG: dihydroorotase [Meiothermus sp.]|uniref:dihydroorotase n=1 Tax=Meiothermus sp. TaxID=1955249 RepID=UPI0025D887ED|nr:dihydroorotase [Meiothermus sp.]MCS7058619.1 dihydroorotase [Meiothermus sp.]MCS7194706.1 dihydroorotase [Meiothermus sp.]MCX7739709.1 dihydroorotase [Meiothermus sp.]MDW8090547.1 dihydroorotase [Meiothermus sp.]MDW8482197.1 dihydroorotase [Meiothermus sp.]